MAITVEISVINHVDGNRELNFPANNAPTFVAAGEFAHELCSIAKKHGFKSDEWSSMVLVIGNNP